MSDTILVATRKGLFRVDRNAGAWQIESVSFIGVPVTSVLRDARDETLYAALNHGHFGVKLHRSDDGAKSWNEVTTPSYPAESTDQLDATPAPPSLHQVWALAAAGPDEAGQLWAGTIPGGLFRTRDRGESWELVRSLWERPERKEWFGGGYDDPGIHSICVDPRDSGHLVVGVSCGGVWVTRDRGETWECKTSGMYAEYMPDEKREHPFIQDPHRVVQCPGAPDVLWAQHHNGVFRTTDGCESWTDIKVPPSKFGFAAAVHPHDPETAWFVPGVKDECRVPVDGQVVVSRTRDGGATFDVLREGLPQKFAYDLVFRHGLDVDETGDRLAMGSTTGSLWTTDDSGETWHLLSAHLPPIYQTLFL